MGRSAFPNDSSIPFRIDVGLEKASSPRYRVSYDDLLPATSRTSNDDIESPTVSIPFLQKELGVMRLNEMHKWLWFVGRPMPPRPLHYQVAVGRNIVIHERMDLHLVWDQHRIFLKPIPRYLLHSEF